tara:strand:- start:24 stop:305 length:282 start_codon:yes stop_codon:yes gene_type:complete
MKKFKFKYSIIYSHEIVVEGKNEMDARDLLNEDYDNGQLEDWTLDSSPTIGFKINSVEPTKDGKELWTEKDEKHKPKKAPFINCFGIDMSKED